MEHIVAHLISMPLEKPRYAPGTQAGVRRARGVKQKMAPDVAGAFTFMGPPRKASPGGMLAFMENEPAGITLPRHGHAFPGALTVTLYSPQYALWLPRPRHQWS